MIQLNPSQPLVDGKGKITQPWYRALSALFGTGQSVHDIAGASPVTYIAPCNGRVIVDGGTVDSVEVKIGNTWYGAGSVGGIYSMAQGDMVRVTYSAVPTMTFIPG